MGARTGKKNLKKNNNNNTIGEKIERVCRKIEGVRTEKTNNKNNITIDEQTERV
jgi:hypothetical protein